MKDKVLIYDTTGGYKRFIKINFNDKFDCESFFDFKEKSAINYSDYVALFFFVNDHNQLWDMLQLYKKVDVSFLATRIVSINENLQNLDDAIFLDLRQSRLEMIDFIKANLKLSGLLQ
jgi:hypothetical protein